MQTEEGWSVSCLDLPGCHSQGDTREEAGIKQVETLELAI
jgi:predicted RNase H-like HicB family nuclease